MDYIGSALWMLVLVFATFLFFGDPDVHGLVIIWLQHQL